MITGCGYMNGLASIYDAAMEIISWQYLKDILTCLNSHCNLDEPGDMSVAQNQPKAN